MAHKTQADLALELQGAASQVTVGALYYHYKSAKDLYKVTGIAILEASDEPCIIYQAQYGAKIPYVRPLFSWLEILDWEGETVQRFTKID